MKTIEYIDREWVYFDKETMRMVEISIRFDLLGVALSMCVMNRAEENGAWACHYFNARMRKVVKIRKAYFGIKEMIFFI